MVFNAPIERANSRHFFHALALAISSASVVSGHDFGALCGALECWERF